jgi:hypothetical protein
VDHVRPLHQVFDGIRPLGDLVFEAFQSSEFLFNPWVDRLQPFLMVFQRLLTSCVNFNFNFSK